MARTQPGETSKPLVIALAFFVLTTLVLGVLTFLAQGDLDKLRADMKKAADDKAAAEKLMTTEEEKKLLYKGAMGLLAADEQGKLQNLRQREAVREEYNQMLGAIDKRVQAVVRTKANEITTKDPRAGGFAMPSRDVLDWEWPADGTLPVSPRTPLVAGVVDQYAAQKLSNIEVQQKAAKADEAIKRADERAKIADDIAARLKRELDQLPVTIAANAKTHDDELGKVRSGYSGEVKNYTEEKQRWEQEKNELNLRIRQLTEDLAKQRNKADILEARNEATQDKFAYDQPHGKVNRRNGDLVEINLGRADNVKPGLKFAVQPSDTPRRGFDARRDQTGTVVAKAKVEVVNVLGEHLSQARIMPGTEVDKIRDSVLPGDLLYNAVWRKGEPDHVALFGVFDLNGDGTDDIKSLARDLTRMGIVVDAYYDLDQKKWAGKLSEKTIYAVQGNLPFKNINPGEPPAVLEAKAQVLKALGEAEKDAKDRGTKVVRMRDFFPRVGMPVNLDVEERRIDQAASRYLKNAAPMGETPAEPEPKPEPKKN